tara:strand:+ start:9740 stop:9973 length:234 start_codon:yes stop_codon:yes gene_type:complete
MATPLQPQFEVQLPFTPREIVQLGWDGFGLVLLEVIKQVPAWAWFLLVVFFVIYAERLVPMLSRWLWRYLTRSSLLG